MAKDKYNLIQKLIREAQFYQDPDHIEQLVQSGKIQHVSPQPLSMAFKELPPECISKWLPALSLEQRVALLDMDLWYQDHLNVQDFSYWLKAYEKVSSFKLQVEFVKSEQFTLFFKGVMNISTFDEEEPTYPDHKNFFLTDDHLLLIEYDELFPCILELKNLLRIFYSELGVENAYTHLFKIVVDSFLVFQEEQYRLKKDRLRDYGMIDYYEAIEFLSSLKTMSQLDNFIKTRNKPLGGVDVYLKNQIISKNTILPYEKIFESMEEELKKITNQERMDFLQFSFIRLVHGTLSIDDSLRKGSIAVTQTGVETRYYLHLGLDYIHSKRKFGEENLFDIFDFFDIYRVGQSLIKIQTSRLKKALARHEFSKKKSHVFLGSYFNNFLEDSWSRPPRCVLDLKTFYTWTDDIQFLEKLLPFISQFQKTYQDILQRGKIKNLLNYCIENIDFEALILSSLVNFALGHYGDSNHAPKMGLSISEVKEFAEKYLYQYLQSSQSFITTFGLQDIAGIESYLSIILRESLTGYDFSKMEEGDFAHVGGPLIYSN